MAKNALVIGVPGNRSSRLPDLNSVIDQAKDIRPVGK